MSLNPFVFVGVGGTGGKTLGVIRQTLSDLLERIGWQDGWPRGWQFLYIDVPADPDAQSEHIPYSIPRTQYVALTDRKSTYSAYSSGIDQRLERTAPDEAQRYSAWHCWEPYPASSVKVNVVNGAGQYRAIGRVCVLAELKRVDAAVASALDAATNAEAAPELLRVQQMMGEGEAAVTDPKPVVFVVGSVAGGSGSGMALDVCDVLRSRGINEINTVLFTPEVFEKPDGSIDPGVAPNTFMALTEVVNAMWTTAQADAPISRDLMFKSGGVSYPVGHGGPSTVFLVGRRNGAVTFASAWDVYKIVGRSLAELALDEALTRDVIAYDVANAQAVAAGGHDGLELSSPRSQARDLAVFRSMGFSRLSVGRENFEKYALDRLARAVTLRLLDAHLLRRQPGSNLSDEELLANAVEDAWGGFLMASRIDELNRANEVTDRLRTLDSPEVEAVQRELRGKARDAIGKVAVKGKVKAADAGAAVYQEVHLAREAVLGAGLRALEPRAREFQTGIQEHLALVIAERIAEDGLPVTAALLKRLIDRSYEAVNSLQADVTEAMQREAETLRSLAVGKPATAVSFPLDATDEVESLLRQGQRATGRALQAQYHDAARAILEDLIKNLLLPWQRAVVDADALLRREARPVNLDSVLDIWPTGDVPGESANVPDYIRPSKVEFLLDDVDRFPENFQAVMERSVAGVKGGTAIQLAIREVASGINLGKQASARTKPVVTYAMVWSPQWELARLPRHAKSTAQVELSLTLKDIRARAHDWLWDDEKFCGTYLRTTLNQYLTDPLASGAEREDRKTRTIGQFQAMVRASLPLIAIDPDMAGKIHGHAQPPFNLHMTAMNVPRDLAAKLEEVAHALLNSPQPITTTTNPKSDVMMMTLLREPYQMMAIASIMDPIVDQWSKLAYGKDFWTWRRARPLPEWVPLSPLALADLVRGWFMARLRGQAYASGDRKSLFLEVGGRTMPLAKDGIRPAAAEDQVGMVAEGLALAQLEAFRERSLEVIEPYRELIKLGASLDDDTNPLTAWVREGGPTAAAEYRELGADVTTESGRREGALALVKAWTEAYAEDVKHLGDVGIAQRHPSFELNAEIMRALNDIKACLSKAVGGIAFR
ncbi:MAG: tubulin-like doman-containing protein [Bifidobacteriaceae bacterium]|nr:tubulin-like doman-containing protein [Bifidobacteriaceae bacterium]